MEDNVPSAPTFVRRVSEIHPQSVILSGARASRSEALETYIKRREEDSRETFLRAVDLPLSERRNVVRELNYMGITAGSMFPGLDGACEELKERNFDF